VPEIAKQSIALFTSVQDFYNSTEFDNNTLMQWLIHQTNSLNLNEQVKVGVATIVQYVTNVGGMVINVLLALILSFFYTIELDSLNHFGHNFLNSTFGWFFQDIKYFADKFINTFGIVIEAQILIALVNTVITVITLIFLHMPNIPSLGVMVFLLSLIPVAGAIISVVPLSLIAYTVGGWQDVVTIVVMIVIIHMLEAYVLNPKFMSSRTKLPIFFTFVVLLVAEHMWGTWGLIVGLPVFTFLLDILDVKKIPVPTIKRRVHKPGA
jgi:predicted PurR-regulated permease PerM